jgi:type IV pilus assembly protein PilA
MVFSSKKQCGFTLVEILLVVSLIAILFGILLFGNQAQLFKSYDAVRKSDLYNIKSALENYYSDHDCYPPDSQLLQILSACDSTEAFSPYLTKVPCDPREHTPYAYVPDDNLACPQAFRLYANLDHPTEDTVTSVCSPQGCGPEIAYNFDVPSDNLPTTPDSPSTPPEAETSPTLSPTPLPLFYCSGPNNCANLSPELTCNPTYQVPSCNGQCSGDNICYPTLK